MSIQFDLKYAPMGNVLKYPPRMGVILGSDVHGATTEDIASLSTAEKFFQMQAPGQFVSVSNSQRTVNGQSISVSGRVVRKDSIKDGDIWHHTIYVK
jgi:hypothetical protein